MRIHPPNFQYRHFSDMDDLAGNVASERNSDTVIVGRYWREAVIHMLKEGTLGI
jgi:hypothetical protein